MDSADTNPYEKPTRTSSSTRQRKGRWCWDSGTGAQITLFMGGSSRQEKTSRANVHPIETTFFWLPAAPKAGAGAKSRGGTSSCHLPPYCRQNHCLCGKLRMGLRSSGVIDIASWKTRLPGHLAYLGAGSSLLC